MLPVCEPVRVSDGEPVGWSACGGQFPRHSASGEPVPWLVCGRGLVAVVCVGGMCCLWLLIGGRWDVLPVCEPVPLSVPSVVLCWMVCLLDGLPVAVDWWPLGCAACP